MPLAPTSLPAPAMPGAYPFNARIEDKANGTPLCSGTQIKPGWVLTGAHCVDGVQPADLQLRTGATDVNAVGQSGMLRRVVDIHIHPRYRGTGEADIALLRLDAGQAASCQGEGGETPCTPANYAGESVYVGAPPGSAFYRSRVQGEAESGDACASGKLANGLALGWGKGETQSLMTAELEIRNHCAGPVDPASVERLIDAVGSGERCPVDSGGALIAFTDTGLPFLVGVAGRGAEACTPQVEPVEFSEVAEGELRDWIEHVTGKQRDRRYGANRRLPAASKRPAETPDALLARAQPVVESPPTIEEPPSDAPPPAAPPPSAAPPPPSTQQNGTLAGAIFVPTYSTNLQLSVPAGYTTPGHPLRIAVAWDGLHFEGEQVYNGTAPYVASYTYDPHGQFSLNVTPVVRVTDPAIIGPGGAPLSVTKPAALTLHPVYDISFSPLRSAERQTHGFFGDCDFGTEGEGTLHWTSILNKDDELARKYVSFPDSGITTGGTVVGDPEWAYAPPVQAFAVAYHLDTGSSGPVHFPVIFFTEDELLPSGPPNGFQTPSGGEALFPFVGDNGTNIATVAVVTRPTDTADDHCRIRFEYEVRVQLDLTPGDADSPPPLASPPPPPPSGGGGGTPPVPGGGSPIQEK